MGNNQPQKKGKSGKEQFNDSEWDKNPFQQEKKEQIFSMKDKQP